MKYSYSTTSFNRLITCHMDLQKIFFEVIKYMDVMILCGHRGKEEQDEAFEKKASKVKWPNSGHNSKPSLAVDVAPYPIDWLDEKRFYKMAALAFEIAVDKEIYLNWGGNWAIMDVSNLHDCPHFYIKDR